MEKLIGEVKTGLVLMFPAVAKPQPQEPHCQLSYEDLLSVALLLREQSINAIMAIECGIANDEEFLFRMRRVNEKSGLLLGAIEAP